MNKFTRKGRRKSLFVQDESTTPEITVEFAYVFFTFTIFPSFVYTNPSVRLKNFLKKIKTVVNLCMNPNDS